MLALLRTLGILLLAFAAGEPKTIEKRDADGHLMYTRQVRDDGHGNQLKNGAEIRYYSDGSSKASEYHYKDDVLDGLWLEWFPPEDGKPGSLKTQLTYHNGQKNGTEWHFLPSKDQKDKQLFSRDDYKDGKRQGKKIEWGAGNVKVFDADYDNGELHGWLQEWYGDSQRRTVAHYVHGAEDGIERHWYDDTGEKLPTKDGEKPAEKKPPQVQIEVEFHKGQKQGIYRELYRNGNLKMLARFRDGQMQGRATEWYEDGMKMSETDYIAGQVEGYKATWYPVEPPKKDDLEKDLGTPSKDASKDASAKDSSSKKDAPKKQTASADAPKKETATVDAASKEMASRDAANKVAASKDPAGKDPAGKDPAGKDAPEKIEHGPKQSLEHFIHGRADGLQVGWYRNGQKHLERTEHDGMKQGTWTEWYENGKIKTTGKYKDDKLTGTVWFYNDDGSQLAIRGYANGLPDGRWAALDADGQLVEDKYYKQGVLVVDKLKKAADKDKPKEGDKAADKPAEKGSDKGPVKDATKGTDKPADKAPDKSAPKN